MNITEISSFYRFAANNKSSSEEWLSLNSKTKKSNAFMILFKIKTTFFWRFVSHSLYTKFIWSVLNYDFVFSCAFVYLSWNKETFVILRFVGFHDSYQVWPLIKTCHWILQNRLVSFSLHCLNIQNGSVSVEFRRFTCRLVFVFIWWRPHECKDVCLSWRVIQITIFSRQMLRKLRGTDRLTFHLSQ